MKAKRRRAGLTALIAASPLALAGVAVAAESLTVPATETFFDEAWQTLQAGGLAPGAVVTVVAGDTLLLNKGYGVKDISTGEPVDPAQTLFQIGSVSKLFTAVAVLALADEGKLDLDADANRYLNEIAIPDTFPQAVTVRHLLSHRGGFSTAPSGFTTDFGRNPGTSPAEIERHLLRLRPPGLITAYDNAGVGLLGYIAGNVDGSDYSQVLERTVFTPLGMQNSAVGIPPGREDDVAACHQVDANGSVEICRSSVMRRGFEGMGGVSATGLDMAKFMSALLAGSRGESQSLLDAGTFAQFTDMSLNRFHPGIPGMGHIIHEDWLAGQRVLAHSGGFNGFTSRVYLFPEQDVGIFISVLANRGLPAHEMNFAFLLDQMKRGRANSALNTQADIQAISTRFAERFFGAAPPPPLAQDPGLEDKLEVIPADRLAGRYRDSFADNHELLGRLFVLGRRFATVRPDGESGLLIDGAGPFLQAAPNLYRDAASGRAVAFRAVGDSIQMAEKTLIQFEKTTRLDNPFLHFLLFLAAAVLLVTGAIRALVSRKKPVSRTFGLLCAGAAVSLLVGVFLELQYYATNYYAHGVTPALIGWRLLINIGWLAALAALVFGIRRSSALFGVGTMTGVLAGAYTAICMLAALTLTVLVVSWGLIGNFTG